MLRLSSRLRRFAGAAMVGCLISMAGCTTVEVPDSSLTGLCADCHGLPGCCRDHVFVFLINGPDPLDCAGVGDLLDWIHQLGFIKTYYGKQCHASKFYKEMWRIHCNDPDARFVLIGFGVGADGVAGMVQLAHMDNMPIDGVVTLAGHCLKTCSFSERSNVLRAIDVVGDGFCHAGGTGWGDTIVLQSVSDHDVPANVTAREVIGQLLVDTAQCVITREPALQQTVTGAKGWHEGADQWSFLLPRAHLDAGQELKVAADAPGNAARETQARTDPGRGGAGELSEPTLIFSSALQAADKP